MWQIEVPPGEVMSYPVNQQTGIGMTGCHAQVNGK